jgi:hypothetical protein
MELYPEYLTLGTTEHVDGAAATANINLIPPVDELWQIMDVYVYHDDNGAARDCTLNVYCPANAETHLLMDMPALVNGVVKVLRKDGINQQRLITNSNFYLRFIVTAIGAGKKGYVRALVYKIRGVPNNVWD